MQYTLFNQFIYNEKNAGYIIGYLDQTDFHDYEPSKIAISLIMWNLYENLKAYMQESLVSLKLRSKFSIN